MSHRTSILPRQSLYPGTSLGGGGNNVGGGGASSQVRLQAKQAELEGLRALRDHSSRMVKEMERLSDEVDGLVEGGDAVASVLSQWEGVFRAIQIARASTSFISPPLQYHNPGLTIDAGDDTNSERSEDDQAEAEDVSTRPTTEKKLLLDTVVRLPIDLDGVDDGEKEEARKGTASGEVA